MGSELHLDVSLTYRPLNAVEVKAMVGKVVTVKCGSHVGQIDWSDSKKVHISGFGALPFDELLKQFQFLDGTPVGVREE